VRKAIDKLVGWLKRLTSTTHLAVGALRGYSGSVTGSATQVGVAANVSFACLAADQPAAQEVTISGGGTWT